MGSVLGKSAFFFGFKSLIFTSSGAVNPRRTVLFFRLMTQTMICPSFREISSPTDRTNADRARQARCTELDHTPIEHL